MKIQFSILLLIINLLIIIKCINVGDGSKDNKQLLLLDNKYREKEEIGLENILFANNDNSIKRSVNGKDSGGGGGKCNSNSNVELDIIWESQLANTISNTPLIVDLFSNGDKQIIISNTHTYIDIINGIDGDRLIGGWPYILAGSSFASSPLVYDINGDGNLDVLVATVNAEIIFINVNNALTIYEKTLKVPPLKVHKKWFDGLDGKHVDASFSLFNRDNLKFEIQKQIKENQQFEDNLKKQQQQQQQQQGGINDYSKNNILTQTQLFSNNLDDEFNPLYSIAYERYLESNKWFSRKDDTYVWVDSHILSTPVIADIDGDGIKELIVAVSYYFDAEKYANPIYKAKLDQEGVLAENYVAGGISVFNLATGDIKWQTHLDLTTDKNDFKGSVYGSPTVVDLDGDGKLEIIIGTAVGFLYVLDYLGNPLTGNYPLVLDSIFTQIVTEDLDANGTLELVVMDTKGNVVCFSMEGDELWSQMVSGKTEFPPSIGDIDGDGVLDVIVSTFTAGIFAWNGKTGEPIIGYPLKFEANILSPLLLLDLQDSSSSSPKGLTIFVHANDGILYSISNSNENAKDKCISRLDIGDFSITKILSNDLIGDGGLNLLVSTFDLKVYCLSILGKSFNPLKVDNAISMIGASGNRFSSYSKTTPIGVMILPSTRQLLIDNNDIIGSEFTIDILILDQFNISSQSSLIKKQYTVSVYFGNIKLINQIQYYSTGIKQITITIPPNLSRSDTKLLTVELKNLNSQFYYDSIPVSFNYYFYRMLKFIIIIPIIITFILILVSNNLNINKNKNKNLLL